MDKEAEEDEPRGHAVQKTVNAVLAVLSVVLFFLTQPLVWRFRFVDWWTVLFVLLCGAALAAVNFGRILLFEPQTGAAVALAVSLSLLVTVMVSKCLGGLLPIAAKAVHLDPAVMASPLITTVVDAVSLLVYFGFARAILGI